MEIKLCKKCNIEKSFDNFRTITSNANKQYYRNTCLDCEKIIINRTSLAYYHKNKDTLKDTRNNYDKIYRKNNKDSIRKRKNEYNKKTRNENPLNKIHHNISSAILKSLKRNGYKKISRTHEILGCSFEEFKVRIESQWEPWMNWDNHGKYNGEINFGWDLDHIIAISSANTEEDIIRLNHYTNFQPLCSKVNRDIKKNK